MRKFFTKKRLIIGGVILVIIVLGYLFFHRGNPGAAVVTDTVKKQDLRQTVLATGQVTSSTDLNLSFKGSGIVQSVNVKVGDPAKQGQVLASLSQRDQAASLTQARGALAAAQANYDKVLAGASSEEVAVAQTTLDNANSAYRTAQQQQEVAVVNAYSALLNSTPAAVAATTNSSVATVSITGTYTGNTEASYTITALDGATTSVHFQIRGSESAFGFATRSLATPLGIRGLYFTIASGTVIPNDTWTVTLPNTQASNYLTNYNAYQTALQTQAAALASAQSAINAAQAALDLKRANARPADVAVARAQILSAEGQVQSASSALENMLIRAPSNGTITAVDIKAGEQATPGKEAIVLQDTSSLHVEANVSEANVAAVQPGETVSFTFDALGPDRTFAGIVQTIDPASTVVSGVVNYKVTASVDKLPEIKPGMTANMNILAAQKLGVLAVQSRAIINKDGKKYVRLVTDPKKKSYREVEVTMGLEADGGLVEVVSGLNEGQEIVTFIK